MLCFEYTVPRGYGARDVGAGWPSHDCGELICNCVYTTHLVYIII